MLADCRGMQDIHVLVLPPSGVVDWPLLPGTSTCGAEEGMDGGGEQNVDVQPANGTEVFHVGTQTSQVQSPQIDMAGVPTSLQPLHVLSTVASHE